MPTIGRPFPPVMRVSSRHSMIRKVVLFPMLHAGLLLRLLCLWLPKEHIQPLFMRKLKLKLKHHVQCSGKEAIDSIVKYFAAPAKSKPSINHGALTTDDFAIEDRLNIDDNIRSFPQQHQQLSIAAASALDAYPRSRSRHLLDETLPLKLRVPSHSSVHSL